MQDLDKKFPPSFFADTDVNPILRSSEQKIFVLKKNAENKQIYSTFMDDFSNYLMKLPNNPVKNHVKTIQNKNLIFLGIAKIKPDNVIARSFITTDDKLAGIALDSQQLGVDPTTGSTESIDECIYATYFSLIRATVYIHKTEIRQNKDLHKLLSTYLYMLFIKAIGPDKLYSEKQKALVHILSIYSYYKHYLKERHSYILSILERDYSKFIGKQYLDEFLPALDKIQNYTSIKDFPKMLIDMKVINESPNILTISLLKMLKPMGFYCLIGPLDYFISLVITAKYPVEFIGSKVPSNDKIQNAVEEIVANYMDKNTYDLTAVK